ncbi:hypothetical protein NPX13_g7333 [Xylaria arbuscula]|uniref:Uncharacterized protein n=1 Tax=Xylaria arbuscula TaxID=114810 RepID=A0A9W8NAI6_9PEZI|nr:hypothetical protein NPX13_g7333 [Xylaria arbuscula]
MNFSTHANLSPAATLQASELLHDFMYGFNVEDDRDRSYLAELATRGIASTEDVNSFIHLSLLRGLEEWDQAMCCASAIRDREYRCDSLDGQDLLAFLSEIYGVDGPSRDRSALLSPRKHRRLRARRGSERRKLKRAGRQRDSPYWNETLVSVPQQTANFLEELQGEALTEQPSRKRRKLSKEVTHQEKATTSQEQSDETLSQACQENTNTIRDDDGNGDGGTRHAFAK